MTVPATAALPPALDAPVRELHHAAAGTLRYYHAQSGDGPPLLLLHSINAAASAMEIKPLFDHYREQRPVIAPDLPGFGLSQRGRLPYSAELYAEVIVELLRQAAGKPADVVALSLTAEFAARAALAAPELFRSLTLVSPTGLGDRPPPGPEVGGRVERLLSLPAVGQSLFRLLVTRPSIRFFLGKAFHGEVPRELVDYACRSARVAGARHAGAAFLSFRLFDRDAVQSLYLPQTVPALVLYDEDPNVGFERLQELLAGNTLWRAERIAPSRGLPHWELPDKTEGALESFWEAAGRLG